MKSKCSFPECKVRVLLVTPECKCGHKFCGAHRGHMDHACSFDYKKEHAQQLLKTMSTAIIGKKIESF
jgi:predicted nucleic acid binding AN1-type Zn finger protein